MPMGWAREGPRKVPKPQPENSSQTASIISLQLDGKRAILDYSHEQTD
jgi:hypothetical protein